METLVIKSENISDIEKLLDFAQNLNVSASLNDKPIDFKLSQGIQNFLKEHGRANTFLTLDESKSFLLQL